MKASEMIEALVDMIKQHGDLPLVVRNRITEYRVLDPVEYLSLETQERKDWDGSMLKEPVLEINY